jgi:hypothetical protein
LPDGLALDPSKGLISGIPKASGTWKFTVQAGDNIGSAAMDLSITINRELAITVTPPFPADLKVGDQCSYTLEAGGGSGSGYKWTVSGKLPAGLAFNSKTCTISGALKKAGTYKFYHQGD